MPDFTDQAEFGSEAQNLDADGFGSLNPLVDGETETEQTVHDWDADFTIAEVGKSFQRYPVLNSFSRMLNEVYKIDYMPP